MRCIVRIVGQWLSMDTFDQIGNALPEGVEIVDHAMKHTVAGREHWLYLSAPPRTVGVPYQNPGDIPPIYTV